MRISSLDLLEGKKIQDHDFACFSVKFFFQADSVCLSGGLEMLFSDEKKHELSIPAKDDQNQPVNVGWLVRYLVDVVMKDSRKEMFVLEGHV